MASLAALQHRYDHRARLPTEALPGGTLTCTGSCTLDTSRCTSTGSGGGGTGGFSGAGGSFGLGAFPGIVDAGRG